MLNLTKIWMFADCRVTCGRWASLQWKWRKGSHVSVKSFIETRQNCFYTSGILCIQYHVVSCSALWSASDACALPHSTKPSSATQVQEVVRLATFCQCARKMLLVFNKFIQACFHVAGRNVSTRSLKLVTWRTTPSVPAPNNCCVILSFASNPWSDRCAYSSKTTSTDTGSTASVSVTWNVGDLVCEA